MQSFKNYLTEGRDAPLYHGTSMKDALSIIISNTLGGMYNQHPIKYGHTNKDVDRHKVWANLVYKGAIKDKNEDEMEALYKKELELAKDKIFTLSKKDIKAKKELETAGKRHPIEGFKQQKGVSLTRNKNFAMRHILDSKGINDVIVLELDQTKLVQTHKITPVNFWALGTDAFLKARHAREKDRGNEATRTEYEEFVYGDIKNLDKYLTKIIVATYTAFMEIEHNNEYKVLSNHPLLWFDGNFVNAKL